MLILKGFMSPLDISKQEEVVYLKESALSFFKKANLKLKYNTIIPAALVMDPDPH